MFAFFPAFQGEKQPEHKEFRRGLKAPKKGGFRHGILGEIFVFGCLVSPEHEIPITYMDGCIYLPDEGIYLVPEARLHRLDDNPLS